MWQPNFFRLEQVPCTIVLENFHHKKPFWKPFDWLMMSYKRKNRAVFLQQLFAIEAKFASTIWRSCVENSTAATFSSTLQGSAELARFQIMRCTAFWAIHLKAFAWESRNIGAYSSVFRGSALLQTTVRKKVPQLQSVILSMCDRLNGQSKLLLSLLILQQFLSNRGDTLGSTDDSGSLLRLKSAASHAAQFTSIQQSQPKDMVAIPTVCIHLARAWTPWNVEIVRIHIFFEQMSTCSTCNKIHINYVWRAAAWW